MRVSKTALLFVQAATAVVAQAIAEAECAALTVLEISTIRTVVINQYYGENTVINIEGGVVINIDNAPTSVDITTVVTVTSTSTVTAAPTAAALNPTVAGTFQLIIGANGAARRQASVPYGAYVYADGSVSTACPASFQFSLSAGRLTGTAGVPYNVAIGGATGASQPFTAGTSGGAGDGDFGTTGGTLSNSLLVATGGGFCFQDGFLRSGSGPECVAVALVVTADCATTSSSTTTTSSTTTSSALPTTTTTTTSSLPFNTNIISTTSSNGYITICESITSTSTSSTSTSSTTPSTTAAPTSITVGGDCESLGPGYFEACACSRGTTSYCSSTASTLTTTITSGIIVGGDCDSLGPEYFAACACSSGTTAYCTSTTTPVTSTTDMTSTSEMTTTTTPVVTSTTAPPPETTAP